MGLVQYPASGGATSVRQIFTSSGNFILPAGFGPDRPLWAKITAVGGGGGGGQGFTAAGGGGGCVVTREIGITGNLPITVGSGGNGGGESGNGARGGTTIVGNAPAVPTNLVRNPFMIGLYGQFETTGWSITTASGSPTYGRADYDTSLNQFYRQRFFDIADASNWQGRFKSHSGIYMHSTSGDSTLQFESEYFNLTAGTTYNYGVYTRTAQSENTITVILDWYDANNNLLNSASPEQFSYNNTNDNKYSDNGVAPAGCVKGKLRIRFRMANTNHQTMLFGTYVSSEVNFCPWESNGNTAFWTGAQFSSYISLLNTNGLVSGQRGIIAGGGGGGMRSTDEGHGGWAHYRFGGVGGHQGGFGSSWSTTGNNSSFTMGGDGGGAGGAPKRDIFRGTNNTTPYTTSNTEGFIGYNVNGSWRTMSWRVPTANYYGRWIAGNAGTSPLQITTWSSTEYAKWQIEGGRPHSTGYSAGGPGCGYYKMESENPSRYHYNGIISHYRELPYGNGGAGSHTGNPNVNSSNNGYMDWAIYGDWNHAGDPGIVVFEYLQS